MGKGNQMSMASPSLLNHKLVNNDGVNCSNNKINVRAYSNNFIILIILGGDLFT